MFTGLIQAVGQVTAAGLKNGQMRLTVRAGQAFPGIVLGESIAMNGACLTVEAAGPGEFSAYVSGESLDKTTLGGLKAGSKVNLERAMALSDRLGGHLVSGHVDCLAQVSERTGAGESVRFTLALPAEHARFVVAKGSVALDGVSLTVNECGPDWLCVNVIPATLDNTTIGGWRPGDKVNVETDVIAKYVVKLIGPLSQSAPKSGGITPEFLKEHGF